MDWAKNFIESNFEEFVIFIMHYQEPEITEERAREVAIKTIQDL